MDIGNIIAASSLVVSGTIGMTYLCAIINRIHTNNPSHKSKKFQQILRSRRRIMMLRNDGHYYSHHSTDYLNCMENFINNHVTPLSYEYKRKNVSSIAMQKSFCSSGEVGEHIKSLISLVLSNKNVMNNVRIFDGLSFNDTNLNIRYTLVMYSDIASSTHFYMIMCDDITFVHVAGIGNEPENCVPQFYAYREAHIELKKMVGTLADLRLIESITQSHHDTIEALNVQPIHDFESISSKKQYELLLKEFPLTVVTVKMTDIKVCSEMIDLIPTVKASEVRRSYSVKIPLASFLEYNCDHLRSDDTDTIRFARMSVDIPENFFKFSGESRDFTQRTLTLDHYLHRNSNRFKGVRMQLERSMPKYGQNKFDAIICDMKISVEFIN